MEQIIQEFTLKMQNGEFSLVLLAISFLGGVIASLSPCSLGILPIIAAYVAGYGETEDKDGVSANFKTFIQLVSFVLGLSLVLTIIGIACAIGGRVFMALGGPYWILIMASFILVMGLNLIGVLELPMPVIVRKMPKSTGKSLVLYPFIVGALFSLAATPCSTPILAGIMSFATLSGNLALAALMLFLFALGQGVIIILIGTSASFLKNMKGFASKSEILLKVAGWLLILSAVFIYIKIFSRFF